MRRTLIICAFIVSASLAVLPFIGRSNTDRRPTSAPVPSSTSSPTPTSNGPPTTQSAPTTTSARAEAFTIAFGGDVHFEGSVRAQLQARGTEMLTEIAPSLRRADLAMVNLETAVTDRGTKAPKEFNFRAPASALPVLTAAGIDVVTMANNHGMDYGSVGLADSLAAARAARLPLVGAGVDEATAYAPFRTVVRGNRVSVLGATDVIDGRLVAAWTATPTRPGLASAKRVERLLAAIRAERARADTVVVYLHWGTERRDCPTDRQRTLATQLVAAGADIIVGSHAHVLLGAGRLGDAFVDYGLGNFVFYSRGGLSAQTGVLTLTVRGRHVDDAGWTPARIQFGTPRPLVGAEASAASSRWAGLRSCTGLTP